MVSSALLSTSVIGMANNNSKAMDTVDMQLGLTAKDDGKAVDLSIYNASMANAFQLSLKLEGDVVYKGIEFNEDIKANGIVNVSYDEATKVIDIVVTSDVDLVKGGILDIGTLIVDGDDGVEYSVNDNVVSGKPTIVMVTPTYDEVCDFDLEEVGDTTISIPDNNTVTPPDTDDTDDGDNGDNGNGGGIEKPSNGVDVAEGLDGVKILTPKTQSDLNIILSEILKKDADAKVVNIHETSTYYLYRVRFKDTIGNAIADANVEIKVLKSISATEGLPGLAEDLDDIVVEDGLTGIKLVIPNNAKQLTTVIDGILAKDKDAKVVSIKEDTMYFMYRVRFKDTIDGATASAYVDVKVSKAISTDKGLPGISVETPSNGNGSNSGSNGGGTVVVRPETKVIELIGDERYDTAVKISQEGWKNGANTVVIVNGSDKHLVDGLSVSPLASIKDAPVLLSNNAKLTENTVKELKRLKPSNVYVIGGEDAMPNSVVQAIKGVLPSVNITRLGGSTRFDTSLEIAKEIDKTNDISKIYVSGGYGEVDALSIASVAGRDKCPIILTDLDGLNSSTFDYIKSEKVEDAYFIGGPTKISDKAISQIDSIVSKDVSKNRIAGDVRKDTNAKVIEKFYSSSDLKSAVITKDSVIVDALTVGSLASKYDMPVIIGEDSLSAEQEKVLRNKRAESIYQVGGGTKQTVINRLKELLDNRK